MILSAHVKILLNAKAQSYTKFHKDFFVFFRDASWLRVEPPLCDQAYRLAWVTFEETK